MSLRHAEIRPADRCAESIRRAGIAMSGRGYKGVLPEDLSGEWVVVRGMFFGLGFLVFLNFGRQMYFGVGEPVLAMYNIECSFNYLAAKYS